jgi:hypothetical protein
VPRSRPNGQVTSTPNEGLTPRRFHEIEPGSEEELEGEMVDREEREAIREQRARHEETRARLRR